jgi:hypothetical protein
LIVRAHCFPAAAYRYFNSVNPVVAGFQYSFALAEIQSSASKLAGRLLGALFYEYPLLYAPDREMACPGIHSTRRCLADFRIL